MRVRSPTSARTVSPGETAVEGLAGLSLMRTWPPRQAAAASGRVLVSRTAHSQRSTRVDSMATIVTAGEQNRGMHGARCSLLERVT